MAVNDEVIRLLLDMGVSKENVQEVARKLDELHATSGRAASGLDKVEQSAGKAAKGAANLGQAALQGGRALQDFAQGGIGGILNNIEGLVAAFGGSAGLAGAMTAVGLAAYFALPKLKEFWKSFSGEGANKIPEAASHVDRLAKSLEETKKRLEELAKAQSLTDRELEEFNKLTEKQLRLEKELDEARKQRKREEEFKAVKEGTAEQESKDLAEGMRAHVGGHQDEMVGEISGLIGQQWIAKRRAMYEALATKFRREGQLSDAEMERFSRVGGELERYNRGEYFDSFMQQAQAELARATSGDVAAHRRLMGLYAGQAAPENSVTHELLRMAGPEEARDNRRAERDYERQRKENAEKNRLAKEARDKAAADAKKAKVETEKLWTQTPEQFAQRMARENPQPPPPGAGRHHEEIAPQPMTRPQQMALDRQRRHADFAAKQHQQRYRQHLMHEARVQHKTPEEVQHDEQARALERRHAAEAARNQSAIARNQAGLADALQNAFMQLLAVQKRIRHLEQSPTASGLQR